MSYVGCIGEISVSTRGQQGAGEAVVEVRGSRQSCIAWSDTPLQRGEKVLVIDDLATQTVLVEPWSVHIHH